MELEKLQKTVKNLSWSLDYFEFCQKVLGENQLTEEQLIKNDYCRRQWKKWQIFTEVLFYFDNSTLEKIMCLRKKTKVALKA